MNESNTTSTTTTTTKVIIQETTATSSTTKIHQITLPTLYTPLVSKASSTNYIDQEHRQTFTVSIFSPFPTPTFTTATTRVKYDPDAFIPPSFQPLLSRASREIPTTTTSSSSLFTTTTSLPSASTETDLQSLDKSEEGSISKSNLIGIIIGSIVGALLLIYLFYVLCWSRRKMLRAKEINKKSNHEENHTETISHFSEKYFHEEHQSIHLPRQAPHYNPNRMYSNTNHHPRHDFLGYYDQVHPSYYIPDESKSSQSSPSMY